ncbi:la protein 1 [Impatiens glandulifera]|uniref:la protein 1 n=1 Tax=Impatiens glandulifera TaxID=253017 RepID=UPI001FB0D6DF|nr:la protein 1 [Impatiens glandulifera]
MATATPLCEETVKKVIRQVEFYFSDSNLPRDKFMSETISNSEDGLIDLSLICSFSRMRTHLNLGDVKSEEVPEETVKAVAETLRSSPFLKVSEDGKRIGRAFELPKPEEVIQQLDNRTIAASPLQYDVKLEDVESFFSQFAKVTSVRLPRHVSDKRLFCGTALIEFSTEEDAESILKQSLVHAGVELELKTKKDFDEERVKLEEASATTNVAVGRNDRKNSTAEETYTKGLIISFTLKKLLPDGSVEEITLKESSNGNDENAGEGVEKVISEKPTEEMEKENVETPEEKVVPAKEGMKDLVSREDLKEIFDKYGSVKYIEFAIGETSGFIRFNEAEAGQKARAAAALAEQGGLIVKDYIATLDSVTGEAEKEYWGKLRGGQGRYKDSKNNRGGGRCV